MAMISVLALCALLVIGLRYPGVLLAGVFYGFPVSALSNLPITMPYTALAMMVLLVVYVMKTRLFYLNLLDLIFVFFLAILCVSAVWAPSWPTASKNALALFLSAVSVYGMGKLSGALGQERLKEFAFAMCTMALITVPIFLTVGNFAWDGRIYLEEGENIAVGLTLAYVTSGLSALAILMWPRGETLMIRLLAVAALGVSLFGISMTGTRGGLIAFVAGAVAFLWFTGWFSFLRRMKWPSAMVLCLACVGVVMVIDSEALLNNRIFNFASYGNVTDTSSAARWLAYSAALKMLYQEPLFGHGLSAFGTQTVHLYPHNIFLEIAVIAGVVGIFMFLVVIGFAATHAYKIYSREKSVFICLLLATVCAGMAQHQISFSIAHGKQLYLIGFVSGLCNQAVRRRIQDVAARAYSGLVAPRQPFRG